MQADGHRNSNDMSKTSRAPSRTMRDLHRLVESEVLGESLFRVMAKQSDSQKRSQAWELLRRLETQTKCGVQQFIERADLPLSGTNRPANIAGTLGGRSLPHLPWRFQLDAVRLATHRYLPAFRRLANAYQSSSYSPFFDYVVNHELAMITFTEQASTSNALCLDDVKRLLDKPVPLPD